MSLHVLPTARNAGVTAPAAPEGDAVAGQGGFAQVIELSAARQARRDRIPTEVMDEVAAASQLYEELRSEGLRMRFEAHQLERRVVCDLIDNQGKVLRPISLSDAVGAYREHDGGGYDPGPEAA